MLCCLVLVCNGGLASDICHMYSNNENFQFHSLSDPFSYGTLLFPSFLSFYFLSHAVCTPQALCFLGPKKEKLGAHWRVFPLLSVSHGPCNGRDCTKPFCTAFLGMLVNVVRKRGHVQSLWTVPSLQSHERQKFGSMVWEDLNCFIVA